MQCFAHSVYCNGPGQWAQTSVPNVAVPKGEITGDPINWHVTIYCFLTT